MNRCIKSLGHIDPQAIALPNGTEVTSRVRADAVLRKLGDALARRWVTVERGPFGADAPPLKAAWDDGESA